MTKIDKKVLVVDDEQDVRSFLQAALEDAGFEVETAEDGQVGLNKMQDFKPDLISLDLVMPKHSGAKMHYELKKNKEWYKIPVLIVTGHANDELGKTDLKNLSMSGPGIYLEKPVKPKTYVTAVCKLLDIEVPQDFKSDEGDPDELREKLKSSLDDADPDALQKALDALKKQ